MRGSILSKPEVLTPEQEIERFVAKALRDRRITVTSNLQKAVVKGVGSPNLILDLEGSRKRKIQTS